MIPLEYLIYIYSLFKRKFQINKYDLLIYMLIFLGIIVTINTVDVQTSIWGAYLRNEGFLSIFSYYLLFLNAREFKNLEIKKILHCIFGTEIVQFIYCILQVFVRGNYVFSFSEKFAYMASVFIGNPNMLGSFCLLLVGLSLGIFLVYNNRKYLWLSVCFFANLLLAQSTGPFLSFIVLYLFLIIFLLLKKQINFKKIMYVSLIFLTTLLVVSNGSENYCEEVFGDVILKSSSIRGDMNSTLGILNGDSNEHYGSGRLVIWENTFKIVPKYFWLGAGIDNFGYVFPPQEFDSYLFGSYVDKAHNEYLQILITQGIFTLVIYFGLLLCMFIDGARSKDKDVWIFLAGFMGYAMQAFMNISVTTVAPFYFIICGFLAGRVYEKKV